MQKSSEYLDNVLTAKNWQAVNLNLLKKILVEFMYEDLIVTETIKLNDTYYQHKLILSPDIYYTFIASPRIFGNWNIDKSSIRLYKSSKEVHELSVSDFICHAYKLIGVNELTLGHYLRELNHTLIADCHLVSNDKNINKNLLELTDFSHFEGYMHAHPWFVINKGRMGFSYPEYLRYAPEMQNLQQLLWIAVKKDSAKFSSIDGLSYQKLIAAELSKVELDYFYQYLDAQQLVHDDYYFMPIHEWQWQRQIIQLFPDDIVKRNIVYLGSSNDNYLATQSIRSFNNQTHRHKLQVKLPLSIFNTAVYRGLPGRRTELAPALSQWIKNKLVSDDFLNQQRLVMLGEIASINYAHKVYQTLPGVPYQYQELLGVIWRENINNDLLQGESVITMASLIHIDNNNVPFINSLIAKSGLSVTDWLERFFSVCIKPLLHWLYKYGMVFSPHGENTMLILDNNYYPAGLVLKDFIDDVNISNMNIAELADLPNVLLDTLYRLNDEDLTQFIHTGLFVVLYRYLSDILCSYSNYPEEVFWQQVHDTITAYHIEHPEFQSRILEIDILKPQFKKLNLNRLRLIHVGYSDYAERPKVETSVLINNPANDKYLRRRINNILKDNSNE